MADPYSIAAFSAGINALSSALIIPYFKKKVEDSLEDSKNPTLDLQHYLKVTLARCNIVNSIALVDRAALEEVYEPMSINVFARDRRISYKIDDYPEHMLADFPHLLIEDRAGQGKSTLMKYIVTRSIHLGKTLPIFIELRRIEKGQSIVNHIGEIMQDADGKNLSSDTVISILKNNKCLVIFDGYDEISENLRAQVTTELQNLILSFKHCNFILTSRMEDALKAFTNLHRSYVEPLELKSAYNLLRRYDQGRGIADRLINQLEENIDHQVRQYLTNPLLVSLLYKAFEYREDIPIEKHMYYQQVFESLFDRHDLAKGDSFKREKKSGLDMHNFDKVMRILCMSTFLREEYEFNNSQLLAAIENAKKMCVGIEFEVGNFLHDLTHAVPLLYQEGTNLKWIHRSIQEYFAAKYLCYETGDKFSSYMEKIYSTNHAVFGYFNILDLIHSMEYKKFRHTMGKKVLEDIVAHYNAEVELTGEPEIAKYTFARPMIISKEPRIVEYQYNLEKSYFSGTYHMIRSRRRIKINKYYYGFVIYHTFKLLVLALLVHSRPFMREDEANMRANPIVPKDIAEMASVMIGDEKYITIQALLSQKKISSEARGKILLALRSYFYQFSFRIEDIQAELIKIEDEIKIDQRGLLDMML